METHSINDLRKSSRILLHILLNSYCAHNIYMHDAIIYYYMTLCIELKTIIIHMWVVRMLLCYLINYKKTFNLHKIPYT